MNFAHVNSTYRKPAEFEPHARSWMIWPHRPDLYGGRLAAMQHEFIAVVRAIAQFEPVTVVAHPNYSDIARQALRGIVTITSLPVDDFWMRDCGPSFLSGSDGGLAGVSWRFNAWGEKHAPWDQDDALARQVIEMEGGKVRESWLCCEGGSFALDGEGTLIVTETSILNPNRNPGVNKALAESELKAMLGVEKVIWLPGDPMDIETDGHIDGLCAFVKPGAVLFGANPDPSDPHTRILNENIACLRKQTDARGRSFEILPLDEAVDVEADSEIFCSSYINFYLVNGGVIVPGYGTRADEAAARTIAAAFPERKTVQVQVRAIAAGGGAIHCITQEQPTTISQQA
ncbi:agmatine deiminase family protein [Nordella sp. HKS 07]|uniref:agmatine deiminase family protein n=1 Tax=Nordella sp. HKS 07 TaxID=2712222 RepID=UPI0013E18122|nr:agmatine deiminase family protein [Nordella sp. HKS 07]QIG50258.1 agmatine deiminase family protein [Nordella sp. HKS 07]